MLNSVGKAVVSYLFSSFRGYLTTPEATGTILSMKCNYCGCSFRITKIYSEAKADTTSCLDCQGIVDDLSIPDDEIILEVNLIRNPSGRTKPVFYDDPEEELLD